jgi:hypothetical protein
MVVAARTARFLSSGVLLVLGACGAPAVVPPPAQPAAAVAGTTPIAEQAIRSRIYFLASDALRGRDTPSPGLESAAAYLASESQRLGLLPAGVDGTYYQRWPFANRQLSLAGTRLSLVGPGGEQELRWGVDFYATPGATSEFEGGLVFVGRELTDAGTAVQATTFRDRVAVVTLPGRVPDRGWRRLRNLQQTQAQAAGATAVLHVLDPGHSDQQLRSLAAAAGQAGRTLVGPEPLPQFFVTYEVARRVLSSADLMLDELWREGLGEDHSPVPLAGIVAHGSARTAELDRAYPPNVVALIPGSDPVLRDEYIVLTAHFDHVGVGQPMNGDSIYNGADDNASGTSALLEIASALTELPAAPRRSVIFLWVSGEEKGLLGSRWYADNPTVPMDRIVANFNLDMIAGDHHRDTVVVIGKEYSSLGDVVDRLQRDLPELGLVASDDIWPEEDFFYRSDHFNFLRYEVPALFFFTGVHECYHRPCDTVDFINARKAARVANLVFHTLLEVANDDERPRWDPRRLEEVRRLTR